MVGDSAGDLRAGRAAGTATCAVAWGFRELATLHALSPDHEAWQFEEVVALAAWRDRRALSLYALLGEETFWRLARAFYGQVDRDPRLRAMFPQDLTAPIEHQARFLVQFFGGPSEYSRQRGHPRLRMRHAPFAITRAASEAWLENMVAAMAEVGIPEPAAGVMRRYFAHTAAFLVNREG
ncbi:MAG: HAD hydrolase-like protein [Planctomycetes bacterium]|nr:HAD hydrolase-like protein [Planctomycetota bacterium]